jgi:ribosomal protein S18 acetylase RimI-like enzyme
VGGCVGHAGRRHSRDPASSGPGGQDLHHEVLDWVDGRTLEALETDVATLTLLAGRGYRRVAPPHPFVHLARRLDRLPAAEVPEGYRLRHVEDGDLELRVEAHRAAFHPSRLTPAIYRELMQTYPYRADLDWVAEAPDGTLASYALCWLDEENRVAELEPVGTHPDHARRGMARAICTAAIRRAAELGAEWAVVYARSDSAYPVPKLLYESIGFRPQARVLELSPAPPRSGG